jgi:predicted ATPase/DNA-binding winged helix-turn-helix (wHTH) protein
VYASDACEIDLARRELRVLGSPVPVGGRAFEIIGLLAQSAGKLITKDELMNHIWPGTIVGENTLQVHAVAIRKALGPYRTLLKTESGRGYRLLGDWTVRRHEATRHPIGIQRIRADDESQVTNFPARVTRLIGRSAAVAQLQDLVSAYRMVSLAGPGGIGKTTLVAEVARSVASGFADGSWLVELAGLSDPAFVPSAVAGALRMELGSNGNTAEAVARVVGDRRLLLVLDNCEHLIGAAAILAETFLALCPHVTILATSRETLRIRGEHVYRVAPLEVPAMEQIESGEILGHSAVELFLARAGALGADFSSNPAHPRTIASICRHLDGIPLAIEFAAARAATLGLEEVANGLRDRFAMLTSGRRTALPRHRTLRATIDWSYDLLPEMERIVLRRLAVFSGDFTIEAAQVVAGNATVSGTEVIESVANLVTKSLVTTDIGTGTACHRLLETTRAYALEKLAEDVDVDRLRRRHAEYFREFFEPCENPVGSLGQAEWLAIYGRQIDNVRTALDWAFSPDGDAKIGVALTAAAVPLWIQLSLLGECRDRVERALANLNGGAIEPARSHMRLAAALAWSLMYGVGRARETGTALHTTLELAEALGDTHYQLRALWGLCIDQFNSGTARGALAFARRFAELAAHSSDPIELMMAERIQGTALHYLGDQNDARRHIDRALAYDGIASWRPRMVSPGFDLVVSTHYFQARILWLQGFADQAMRVVTVNVEEGLALDQALTFCSVLGQAACPIALFAGDLDAAERYGAMLLDHTERHQIRLWNIWARCFNGVVRARRGDSANGLRGLREGLIEAGDARLLPRFLFLEAEEATWRGGSGESELALASVDKMLARCAARDERWYVPELSRIKGELMRMAGDATDVAAIETLFLQSLEEARQQGAVAWELRTATSLALLQRDLGRATEAAALLRPIHARLTEGVTTADARAAQALLDELP